MEVQAYERGYARSFSPSGPALRCVLEVSKSAVYVPGQPNWLCGNKRKVVASDDVSVMGLLTSCTHRTWMHIQKGTLEGRTACTHDTCFETFPFPQLVSP